MEEYCHNCTASRESLSTRREDTTVHTRIPKRSFHSGSEHENGCESTGSTRTRTSHLRLSSGVLFVLSVVLLGLLLGASGVEGGRIRHLRSRTAQEEERDQASAVVAKDASSGVDLTGFLMQYGYLPESDMETGALRTKKEMERAISEFQEYANLPPTGLLDAETKRMMVKPRCGVKDVLGGHGHNHRNRRYVIGPSKWDKKGLGFRIINYTPDLEYNEVRRAVIEAFRVWQDVAQLSFYEVTRPGETIDIEIKFARGYHGDGYGFDGEGMVLAHAFFPGEDRGGDVHFDDDEHWTAYTTEGTNLFTVAAHEIGHALGLAHSDVPGSLMYPWYQGYTPNFQLHTDDIMAIQEMYGAKSRPPFPTARPTAPATTTTTARTTTTRRPYPPQPTPTPQGEDTPPNPCTARLDAISVIRNEIFAFTGNWVWRRDSNRIIPGFPAKLHDFWYGFPKSVDHVDAVYERLSDGKIVFFVGQRYWVFNSNSIATGFPEEGKPLTDLGLPREIERVDAVFVWGYNKKTYIISGDMYWRYNEENGYVEYDYPRDMSMWSGVALPVDSAFQYLDGRTYFFSGLYYQEFHDQRMSSKDRNLLGPFWLQCVPNRFEKNNEPRVGGPGDGKAAVGGVEDENSGSASNHLISLALAAVVLLRAAVSVTQF